MEVLGHRDGLLRHMVNASSVGWSILAQLQAEMWTTPDLRERTEPFAAFLRRHFPRQPGDELRPPHAPHLTMTFQTRHGLASFRAIQTLAGLAQNITPCTPRTTLWYPLDDVARTLLQDDAPVRFVAA